MNKRRETDLPLVHPKKEEKSPEKIIRWYIDQYYKHLPEGIRQKEEAHIEYIEQIDKEYRRTITRNGIQSEEYYADKFIESIDFLTQAFTRKSERQNKKPQDWTKQFSKQ